CARSLQRPTAAEGQRTAARSSQAAAGAQEGWEVHRSECDGAGGGVPSASSGWLGDRGCELAGSEVGEGAGGRGGMVGPCGADLKIYLHRAPIDMRKGRNALATLAQEVIKVDPFGGALFVYVGRRFNALKLIYWERNGFALWSKRIEGAEKYHWPRMLQE